MDYNGKLYVKVPEGIGDAGGLSLTGFQINYNTDNDITLEFTYSDLFYYGDDPYSITVTMIRENGKWLFREGFYSSIDMDDPIITGANVSKDTFNGYDVALYEEDKIGTVTNTGSYGLLFRSTPEKLDDKSNRIATIKDGTVLPILGYYVHDSKWIYTKYNGEYGFVCSQNNGEIYLKQ